jgi:hypothetical protein
MRFKVLTAVSMKKTVLWDIARCSLVESDGCFKVEAVSHYQTTQCNITEDSQTIQDYIPH